MRSAIRTANQTSSSLNALPGSPDPGSPAWYRPALVGGVLLLIATLSLVVALTPRGPGCYDLARERQQVQDFLARGQSAIASGLAETALGQQQPPLCSEPRRALTGLWYAASLEELFATPGGSDSVSRQTPQKWLAIEEKADRLGLPRAERQLPLKVAQQALALRLWPLADLALRRAFESGERGLDLIGLRYAVLRGWGGDLAFRGSAETRAEGIRLLGTAQAIDTAWRLNNGVVCLDLQRLGYAACNEAQPDSTDPMLAALLTSANLPSER